MDVSPPFYSSGAQDFYMNVCFVANRSSEKERVDKINALEREASTGEQDLSCVQWLEKNESSGQMCSDS